MKHFVKSFVSSKIILVAGLSLVLTYIVWPMDAQAEPTSSFYNFSFTSNIPTGGSILGRFEVIPGGNGGSFPYTITGITGNVTGFQVVGSNGPIFGLIAPGNFGSNDNWFSPNLNYVTGGGVSFHTNSSSGASFELSYNGVTWTVQDTYNGFGEVYYGTMTSALSQ